ncbi:MAG: exopolysaccharide biosynthesis polyprenyl glycosylphosphotransferase [Acidiphilium sp.]
MSPPTASGLAAAPSFELPFGPIETASKSTLVAAGTPRARIGFVFLLMASDFAAALAAPGLATVLAGPTPTMAVGPSVWALYGAVTVASMLANGFYGVAPARAPLDHAWRLLRTLVAAHLIVLLRIALTRPMPATPPVAASIGWAATVFGLAAISLLAARLLVAAWWRRDAVAAPRGATALVAASPCDRALAARLDRLAGSRLGYMFAWGGAGAAGLRMIADVEAFEAMIRAGAVDDIVVFIRREDDSAARRRIDALLARLADRPVRVRLAFDAVAEIGAGGVATGQGLRVVTVLDRPIRPVAAAGKRVVDILGAALLLILLAVPMAPIALALRHTGPVLFRQRRIGLDGMPFTVLKFRTMRPAPKGSGTIQARPGDARITPLGAMLRRFSLDELPQLFNVLRGEMSLVGPRPHAQHTSTGDFTFEQAIAFYGVRHRVKPGLTGLAQVRGLRGPTERPEAVAARVAADLDYIAHWSPWLDLAILLRTIPAVLRGRNAY